MAKGGASRSTGWRITSAWLPEPPVSGGRPGHRSREFALQVPARRVQPQCPAAVGVEERIQLQQLADDGGAAGGEVGVADVRESLA